jgi:hypothetical protein
MLLFSGIPFQPTRHLSRVTDKGPYISSFASQHHGDLGLLQLDCLPRTIASQGNLFVTVSHWPIGSNWHAKRPATCYKPGIRRENELPRHPNCKIWCLSLVSVSKWHPHEGAKVR